MSGSVKSKFDVEIDLDMEDIHLSLGPEEDPDVCLRCGTAIRQGETVVVQYGGITHPTCSMRKGKEG